MFRRGAFELSPFDNRYSKIACPKYMLSMLLTSMAMSGPGKCRFQIYIVIYPLRNPFRHEGPYTSEIRILMRVSNGHAPCIGPVQGLTVPMSTDHAKCQELAAALEDRADSVVWVDAAVGVQRLGDGSLMTEVDTRALALAVCD